MRVRVARRRQRGFLPVGVAWFERRAADVRGLIREAFLRGRSTRAVGRLVALMTEEPVRAQTVARVPRALAQAVAPCHQALLTDDWRDIGFWRACAYECGAPVDATGSSV